jgi:hypothetical protein
MNNEDDYKEEKHNSISNSKPKRSTTLRMSQQFNEKYFNEIRKNIELTDLTVMKDDIKNYKPLTAMQLLQLDNLTEEEKIDIIHLYNTMISTLEDMIVK